MYTPSIGKPGDEPYYLLFGNAGTPATHYIYLSARASRRSVWALHDKRSDRLIGEFGEFQDALDRFLEMR